MPDKKVSRNGQGRPLTPTQRMEAALSEPGTVNMAESSHDKAKTTLVDKFRGREERWQREQAIQEQKVAAAHEAAPKMADGTVAPAEEGAATEPHGRSEGGAS